MGRRSDPVRVLVVPGLRGSGPAHWQSWLEGRLRRRARRVEQDDWATADLDAWSRRIGETVRAEPPARWVAVAHSFGCLALAHHLAAAPAEGPVAAALFVAPADPARFGATDALPQRPLGVPALLVASDTDPWMAAADARAWARRWGSGCINLGDAGHINAEAGFGPWPRALDLIDVLARRVEQARRLLRADVRELSYAV